MPDGGPPPRASGRAAAGPRWLGREARLDALLPYAFPIADDLVELRSGAVLAGLALAGVDAAAAQESASTALRDRLAHALTGLDDRISVYAHRISAAAPAEMPAGAGEGFADRIAARWAAHLAQRRLRRRRSVLCLVVHPPRAAGLFARRRGVEASLARRAARARELTEALTGALRPAGPRILSHAAGDWIDLIGALTGFGPRIVSGGAGSAAFTRQAAAGPVRFDGPRITIFGDDARPARWGEIHSLKSYAAKTWPGMFDELDLAVDLVVTQSFSVLPRQDMLEEIALVRRRMAAVEDAAVSLRDELEEAADDLEAERIVFGRHHLSVATYAEDDAALETAGAALREAGLSAGVRLVREGFGARAAWFAQHPGSESFRARAAPISSRNFADMAAFHHRPPGRGSDEAPWGAPLAILPQISGEPYRFNLHARGDFGRGETRREPTSGMTVAIGPPGAGKSTFAAFLIAMTARQGVRIVVFDKDRGLEMAVRALGGVYAVIEAGRATGFNPFATETDERGVAWMTEWLAALIETEAALTPRQSAALADAARETARWPALQRIGAFRERFHGLDDDGAPAGRLSDRLGEWDRAGRYGWTLAPASAPLPLEAEILAFDMTELLGLRRERMAILAYLLQRIERRIEDRRPTLILCDEAWSLFDDPWFARRLKAWAVTLRKHNAALVALSQLPGHFGGTEAGRILAEVAVTRLVFPNPASRAEDYALIGFNERMQAMAAAAPATPRLALLASDGDEVLLDLDLSALGPLLTILGGGRAGEAACGPDWREEDAFWRRCVA